MLANADREMLEPTILVKSELTDIVKSTEFHS